MLGFSKKHISIKTNPGKRLIISGSVNPLAQEQILYSISHSNYTSYEFTNKQLLEDNCNEPEMDNLWKEAIRTDKLVIWSNGGSKALKETELEAELKKVSKSELPERIANNIGQISSKLIRSGLFCVVIIFGGDTLLGIANHLGCYSFKPITDIMPGVVLATLTDDRYANLCFVTKAGGYGNKDVVREIDEYLDLHMTKNGF